MLKIKDQIRNPETRSITYDAGNKVTFKIGYMKKSEFQRLIQKHTKMEFNTKTHQREEVIGHEKLSLEIFHTYILGWEGLTHEWLATKIPYEIPADVKPTDPVEFSTDNLDAIVEALYGIDAWAMEAIKNFDNFNEKKEAQAKN